MISFLFYIFPSWDHLITGIVEVRRDLWKWSSLTPPVQSRVIYSRLLRAVSSWVLIISEGGDSKICLPSLLQYLYHPSPVKPFFLLFTCSFLYVSLCMLPLVLLLGATKKSLAPSSLLSPIRYLYIYLQTFSLLGLKSPVSPCVTYLCHLWGPSIDLLQYVHVSPVLGSPV